MVAVNTQTCADNIAGIQGHHAVAHAAQDAFVVVLHVLHVGEQDGDDLRDVLLAKRVEHDHVVDAVQELRPEVLLDLAPDRVLDVLTRLAEFPEKIYEY